MFFIDVSFGQHRQCPGTGHRRYALLQPHALDLFSMAMIFFVTFVLVLCKVQDIYVPRKDTRHLETVKQVSQIRIVLQNPVLLLFTICLAALTLCYINLDFMLPLQLRDLFGLDAGSKYSSLVWTINGCVVVFCTPVIVSFTKKNHPLFNIGFACLLYAVGFSLYGFASSIAIYMMAVVIWTSGEILISTCAGIYIADQSPGDPQRQKHVSLRVCQRSGQADRTSLHRLAAAVTYLCSDMVHYRRHLSRHRYRHLVPLPKQASLKCGFDKFSNPAKVP